MFWENINSLEDKYRCFNLILDFLGNLLDCICDIIFFIYWIRDLEINF